MSHERELPVAVDVEHTMDEEQLRRGVAESERLFALPVDSYIGLSLEDAEAFAVAQGRVIENLSAKSWITMDFCGARVRVCLDDAGRVEQASAG